MPAAVSIRKKKSWRQVGTSCTAMALFLLVIAGAMPARAIDIVKPKAVVELFTSQGCSSCPPADAVLGEFNAGGDILGLALHVDYWDRLGWADTFASPENTKRQWRYARSLGERQVYTPQAIINGRTHVVGSRKSQIEEAARSMNASNNGLSVPVQVTSADGAVAVSVPANELAIHATLYAFYFSPSREVEISRGENAGRMLKYTNIVRNVEMIGMVGRNGLSTAFSISDLKNKGYKGCALILQASTSEGNPGPILGASVIRDL